MRTASAMRFLCHASAIPSGSALRAELCGDAYAVFNVNGRFYVTQDQCTHGPGLLSEGVVEGQEVECPFHGGRFDLRSGQPAAPPCTVPIKIWTAQVIDGKILIDPAETG